MIAVVDAGSGNLRSVGKALAAVGAEPVITSDPDRIAAADRVVMPGQGAFRDCMAGLGRGLGEALREHIARGKPYFGICLGLQILFEESDEQGPCAGLGLFRGRVVRFPATAGLKVPHMGWNQVTSNALVPVRSGEHFYFVHSYYAVPEDTKTIALTTRYGDLEFCAAVHKDNVTATQFHPEKSQQAGLALLRWFSCS